MIDVRVQAGDFDPGRQLARLAALSPAAIASLVAHAPRSEEVSGVFIEHYAAMARLELGRIAAEASERWTLAGIIILHRHGLLNPGDRVMFAAACAAGSADAAAACTFLADAIGRRAPFWRRETLIDGTSRWAQGRV